ncbi:MAG: FAD-dependent oxidoreductase [Pseudomonadota bacterium]
MATAKCKSGKDTTAHKAHPAKLVTPALTRRGLMISGISAGVGACTNAPLAPVASPSTRLAYGVSGLKPLDLFLGNLTKITVCTRPFRPAGPRLESERIGSKFLVHNYGHGGSGWSLAWGYAEAVRDMVAAAHPKSVTVLGAGAMGLTAAIAIAETGAMVTIVAREMPMDTRSARATGVWSPSSRIGLEGAIAPGFTAQWQAFTRRSYARHMTYVGRAGHPVEFTPRFYVRTAEPYPELVPEPEGADRFLRLDRTLNGLTPPWRERENTPFPAPNGVRGGLVMTFNIAEYTRQLVEDFQAMGGRFELGELSSKDDLANLPGDAIVNCSGFGAKTLLDDASIIPVRGQIAWMAPQLDRLYGVYHAGVSVISRRDGLLIQETGGNDFYGLGIEDETQSQDEFLAAQAKVAPIFRW